MNDSTKDTIEHVYINGVGKPISVSPGWKLSDFVQHLRKSINSEKELISYLSVNGVELSEHNENDLGMLSVSEIERVEIVTTHPRELIEDTLQILRPFVARLRTTSLEVADQKSSNELAPKMMKLVDGIQTLSETLIAVKNLLSMDNFQAIEPLEKELLAILNDLLVARESRDDEALRQILKIRLAPHLYEWGVIGIPALIRSRDS